MKATNHNRALLAEEFNRCEALRIIGDCHMPLLNPGDWVLIDLHQNRLTVDSRYAVNNGGGIDVRWLNWLPGRLVRMACGNPAMPVHVVAADEIDIVGRVVGTIRRC